MAKLKLYNYPLEFKSPIGTSRGKLHHRGTWFINNEAKIYGEAGYLPGLTRDHTEDYPHLIDKLNDIISNTVSRTDDALLPLEENEEIRSLLKNYPALYFALETINFWAEHSLTNPTPTPATLTSPLTSSPVLENFFSGLVGIPVNGLIWMGDMDYQHSQIKTLLQNGFTTIKLKIGGLDFNEELALLDTLCRSMDKILQTHPSPADLQFTIRFDANGAFSTADAPKKLAALYNVTEGFPSLSQKHPLIHSIEQPLPVATTPADYPIHAKIFNESPIKIALDEELIGKISPQEKSELISTLRHHYLVLKPGIHGGFRQCEEWISLAMPYNIGWWVTSALESNLALTTITCWTAKLLAAHYKDKATFHYDDLPTQGLGTGSLYLNNFWSPLKIKRGKLFLDSSGLGKMLKDVGVKVG